MTLSDGLNEVTAKVTGDFQNTNYDKDKVSELGVRLHKEFVDSIAGRVESDIPIDDVYWKRKHAFQVYNNLKREYEQNPPKVVKSDTMPSVANFEVTESTESNELDRESQRAIVNSETVDEVKELKNEGILGEDVKTEQVKKSTRK